MKRESLVDPGKSTGWSYREIPLAGDGIIGVSVHNDQPLFLISVMEPSMRRGGSVALDAITAIALYDDLGTLIQRLEEPNRSPTIDPNKIL